MFADCTTELSAYTFSMWIYSDYRCKYLEVEEAEHAVSAAKTNYMKSVVWSEINDCNSVRHCDFFL